MMGTMNDLSYIGRPGVDEERHIACPLAYITQYLSV
jgi:hypothetical protein